MNEALDALWSDFDRLYGRIGRPGVPPEKLLSALLQAFYSMPSERQLMERLDFELLFRWFVGLGINDPVWDHSTFSKNRDRLLEGDVAARFMAEVLNRPEVRRLLSDDHSSVDGTLIEAFASMKSLRPRGAGGDGGAGGGRNREADFRGQQGKNDTHASTTDGDARLYRKGHRQESRLAYLAQRRCFGIQRVAIGAEFCVLTLGLSPRFVCLCLFGAGHLDGFTMLPILVGGPNRCWKSIQARRTVLS